jgi:TPR repeat protein
MFSIRTAKSLLRQKRFQEAIGLFEGIANEKSIDSSEALYCLGIIYHSGTAVPQDLAKAKDYYLAAERLGHAMASYRLGGMYLSIGDLSRAYGIYCSVAHTVPSAAYKAYRLLKIDRGLDEDSGAGEKYLQSAAQQGHVLAERVIALRHISGSEGLRNIPYGFKLFTENVRNIFRVVNAGEKMKYE